MTERAYTVREIDELRAACQNRLLLMFVRGTDGSANLGSLEAMDSRAEEMVRTHMLAGHVAADIRAGMEADQNDPLQRDRHGVTKGMRDYLRGGR